jgi:hypothetical protein
MLYGSSASRIEAQPTLTKRGFRTLPLVAFLALFLSLTIFFGVSFKAPIAHAGTNGQQLAVTTHAAWVEIDGYNQNNKHVVLFVQIPHPGQTDYIGGFWWEGPTSLDFFNANRIWIGGLDTQIPTNQSGNWWYISAY